MLRRTLLSPVMESYWELEMLLYSENKPFIDQIHIKMHKYGKNVYLHVQRILNGHTGILYLSSPWLIDFLAAERQHGALGPRSPLLAARHVHRSTEAHPEAI